MTFLPYELRKDHYPISQRGEIWSKVTNLVSGRSRNGTVSQPLGMCSSSVCTHWQCFKCAFKYYIVLLMRKEVFQCIYPTSKEKSLGQTKMKRRLGLTGMKIVLSTGRNKSFSGWHCAVPAQGVLVTFWSGESSAWRVISFRMDQIPLEWIRWEWSEWAAAFRKKRRK